MTHPLFPDHDRDDPTAPASAGLPTIRDPEVPDQVADVDDEGNVLPSEPAPPPDQLAPLPVADAVVDDEDEDEDCEDDDEDEAE